MPCDILLLTGSCILNESMLTGESIPVIKTCITMTDTKFSHEDKNHILYNGTECLQKKGYGNQAVMGIVLNTGFYTAKGQLIRSIMFPKIMKFRFDEDSKKFILIMLAISVGSYLYFFIWLETGGDEWSTWDIVMKGLEIFTVAVPPVLPLCMTIGMEFSLTRLKKKKIFCINPTKINVSGRVKVCCFDKTGTLTEDSLRLAGLQMSTTTTKNGNIKKAEFTEKYEKVSQILDIKDQDETFGKVMTQYDRPPHRA